MLEKNVYDLLFSKSFTIPVEITYWDGITKRYGQEGVPVAQLTIREKIPMKEIYQNASLTLGEAYMRGDIEIEGSIQALITNAYLQADSFFNDSRFKKLIPQAVKHPHTKKSNKEDIKTHYDLGNDFYKLWLDETYTYSCAYFENENDSLYQAQLNKVKHILEKLFIQKGDTLLDIGCGWGTLMLYAVKEYGVKATGITLSEEQYAFVKERIAAEGLQDRCDVKLIDYRDLGRETYDHIVSVGMFEHVGAAELPNYFRIVKEHLKPDGTALIHGITRQQGGASNAWIDKYIFPGGYIPGLVEIVESITDNKLQVIDLESLRRHYQKTLEHWTENFHEVKEAVIEQQSEAFYRMWDLYLQSCAASFEANNIDVIQYLLVNPANNSIPMHRNV